MPRKYYSHAITLIQVLADFLTVVGSVMLAYVFYHYLYRVAGIGTGSQPFPTYLNLGLGIGVLFVVIFEKVGLYKRQMSILNIEEIKSIFKAILLGFTIFLVVSFYIRQISYSRLIISYSLVMMFIFVNLERAFFFKLHQRFHVRGIGVRRVLLYGAGEVGKLLCRRMLQSPRSGYLPIGFVDDNKAPIGANMPLDTHYCSPGAKILGRFEDLEQVVKTEKIDEIFVAMPSAHCERKLQIVHKCRELKVGFSFVPDVLGLRIEKMTMETVDGVPLLSARDYQPSGLANFFKRPLDVLVSSLVLFLVSPLLVIIALLVRRDAPGPVIFRQSRVGRGGKKFLMYKFRTMYVDAPAHQAKPMSQDDPRITKVGRFLRRTSLDELPQFWNVLRGDMSVVGPRPEMPFIVETYNDLHQERLALKPGITGLWQVSADRARPIHENMDYDLYYMENMSPLLDVVIILRTVWFAIRGIGAV